MQLLLLPEWKDERLQLHHRGTQDIRGSRNKTHWTAHVAIWATTVAIKVTEHLLFAAEGGGERERNFCGGGKLLVYVNISLKGVNGNSQDHLPVGFSFTSLFISSLWHSVYYLDQHQLLSDPGLPALNDLTEYWRGDGRRRRRRILFHYPTSIFYVIWAAAAN